MAIHLPNSQTVRDKLAALSHAEIVRLAEESGVPFMTLWNIRSGTTQNTRLGTLQKFWPLIESRKTNAGQSA